MIVSISRELLLLVYICDKGKTHNICPARNVGQLHPCRKRRVIEPLKHLIRTHHARRRHRQQVGQVKLFSRCDAALHQLAHPPRTYPHHRHFLLFSNPQQHLCVRCQWRSIVSNTASAEKRVRDTGLVHDPAGGGVLQTCIRGPDAPVDVDFLCHG